MKSTESFETKKQNCQALTSRENIIMNPSVLLTLQNVPVFC